MSARCLIHVGCKSAQATACGLGAFTFVYPVVQARLRWSLAFSGRGIPIPALWNLKWVDHAVTV